MIGRCGPLLLQIAVFWHTSNLQRLAPFFCNIAGHVGSQQVPWLEVLLKTELHQDSWMLLMLIHKVLRFNQNETTVAQCTLTLQNDID